MTMTGQHARRASVGSGGESRQTATDMGRVVRISGPVVSATALPHTRLFDVVRVGEEQLLGEVIKIDGDLVVMQVFEDTTGMQVGEPVEATARARTSYSGQGVGFVNWATSTPRASRAASAAAVASCS
jgi:V/A-type H+/Na+-transporting ATPase subunit A